MKISGQLTGVAAPSLSVKALAQMATGSQGSYVEPVSQSTLRPTFTK